jgi:transposase
VNKRLRSKSGDSECMYVGLDLHKNYLQAAVVDRKGSLLKEQRIPNQDESIKRFLDRELKKSRNNEIAIESSSTWHHVYELLSENLHNHVTLLILVKTKAIASSRRRLTIPNDFSFWHY